MKKLLFALVMAAACAFAKDQYDIKPDAAKAGEALSAVDWQNKNDAALKAAEVTLCKLYSPPTETNFGGGLLSGTQSACDAACAAFLQAVSEVAQRPRER